MTGRDELAHLANDVVNLAEDALRDSSTGAVGKTAVVHAADGTPWAATITCQLRPMVQPVTEPAPEPAPSDPAPPPGTTTDEPLEF